MPTRGSSGRRARFDVYEADLSSGELLRSGTRVPIQEQPFHILRLLMESPGQVVTREQIRAALWPEDTFVDFEHGVNTAVRKLRQALEDSVEDARFVETLPKIGYRFMAPVVWEGNAVQTNRDTMAPAVIAAEPSVDAAKPRPGRRSSLSYWTWRAAPIGLAVVLVGWIGFDLFGARRQDPPESLTIVPLTTFPGFEIEPSFSPDGNEISFSWFGYEKEFQFDLYIKQVGEERVVQLTHHPATFLASDWSPDGRTIAFMRQAEPEATGVYVIPAIGGPERKLVSLPRYDGFESIGVSWTADSQWLAFAKAAPAGASPESPPGHFSIHLVNVNSAEERMLPAPSPACVDVLRPALSPDGRSLATACTLTGGGAQLYVQQTDGGNPREVHGAASAQGFAGLAWTADSRDLVYSADLYLWRIPLTGGKPERLLFAQESESVIVARAGHRLAFSQTRHPLSIWQLDIGAKRSDQGRAAKLISSSLGDVDAHFSPDGHSIAFVSWRSGTQEIWVCDRDGSNVVQVTAFGGPSLSSPSWSPDSRRLTFDVNASGTATLYIVNVSERRPRPFVTTTTNASNPFWSADGNWIYFSTERPGGIWKAPLQGGPAIRLTEGEGHSLPRESEDGTRVFFFNAARAAPGLWSASTSGGDAHPITGLPPGIWWLPVRGGYYYISGSSRHFSLRYFDEASRRDAMIAEMPSLFLAGGLNLSPDRRTMLFFGIEHSEGDIMLAQGFH